MEPVLRLSRWNSGWFREICGSKAVLVIKTEGNYSGLLRGDTGCGWLGFLGEPGSRESDNNDDGRNNGDRKSG